MMTSAASMLFGLMALAASASPAQVVPYDGPWRAPEGSTHYPLWPGTPPNSIAHALPESVQIRPLKNGRVGDTYTTVGNVSTPTITVFPPHGPSTGTALVVFPGGGFHVLAMDIEGTEVCDWAIEIGITCVLLKYRVPGSNHHWDRDCRCHRTPDPNTSLQDAQRALRWVRHHAAELGIDPHKVGVIGFSAGGYLVAQTSVLKASEYPAVDVMDTQPSRPDFAIALYPGHLCRAGGVLDPELTVTADAPPTFLLHAQDDPVDNPCHTALYAQALQAAGVHTELVTPEHGGHAFGLRPRDQPVAQWPTRVAHWLQTQDLLAP